MARSHAKLSTSVWTDEDHRALSITAQWLYAYLLANPRLSICGVMDVSVGRWVRQAPDATPEALRAALGDLEAVGHVCVDWGTEELMFRTFTRHDLSAKRWNKNLTAGFWRAWRGVESVDIRARVVLQIPRELWDKLEVSAPDEARCFRRSPRLEPQAHVRSEPQDDLRLEPDEGLRLEPTSPSTSPFSQSPRSSISSQSGFTTLSTGEAS